MAQDNYMSKFKPSSYFFTDPSAITQVEVQAFGPKSADVYDLTARFTITETQAYAICKGAVLVQPQSNNANCVNLILRPYTQPIPGFNIKYFIYRGLKKSDFFSGNNVLPSSSGASDFIQKINESFSSFYTSTGQTAPTFEAKFIGYDPSKDDSLLLDDFFFKQSEYVESGGEFEEEGDMAFELPLIFEGASLGNFAAGERGIDVVLSYGDYKLPQPNSEFLFNLAYARSANAQISLTGLTDEFQKKLLKEQIFQFLDIAAFYGFHTGNGIVYLKSGTTATKKTGVAIYNDLLQSFYTKNKLYLYIQSDRTRSYDFYGNYAISDTNSNNLKIGIAENALAETVYGTDGWPVIVQSASQNHSNIENTLYLQLTTDNNVNTMLYGQIANIVNAQHNNFSNADDLALPNNPDGTAVGLTKILTLANPAVGPDGSKLNVVSFNILIYQGKVYQYKAGEELDENNQPVDVFASPNFFDDVFDQLDAEPLLKPNNDSSYSVLVSQRMKLINHYYNQTQYGISSVQTTRILDEIDTEDVNEPTLARVTYVSETVDTLNKSISLSGKISNDTKLSSSVSGGVITKKTYELPDPFYFDLIKITEGTQAINAPTLKTNDNTIPDKILLGLTLTEVENLVELVTSNLLVNAKIYLFDLFEDGSKLVSLENILYQKYKLGIVGEQNHNKPELFMPVQEIYVYSLDRKFHFTNNYSSNMKLQVKSDYTINKTL